MAKKCTNSRKQSRRMRGGSSATTLPFFDITKDSRNPSLLVDSRQYEMVGGRRKRRSRRCKSSRKIRGGNAALLSSVMPNSMLNSGLINGSSKLTMSNYNL